MNVDLDIDGPRDPDRLREVAGLFAEAARVMGHITRDPAAFRSPADVDWFLREVSRAVACLPQVIGQGRGWLAAGQAAGRIEMHGGAAGAPGTALAAAAIYLQEAAANARELQENLDRAAAITANMAATGSR